MKRKIKVIISYNVGNIQDDINKWLESDEAQGITIISISSAAYENSSLSDVILNYILYEVDEKF